MKRIIYCSRASDDFAPQELVALLEAARRSNATAGVSGMLLYSNQSFLQVLEGEAAALASTYARIAVDDRHTDLRLLLEAEVAAPLFPDWTMGFDHVDDESLAAELEGFTAATEYPLVNPHLITNASVAETLLKLYARNRLPMSSESVTPGQDTRPVPLQTEVALFSLAGHDGRLREVDGAFASLLGRDPEDMTGRSMLEFVHPEDIVQIVAGIAALEQGTTEVTMENRFLQADGRAVHLEWVARSVPGTDSWRAAGRNTTEFHELLNQQRDLRASLDLALGQTTAAMWELDVRTGAFSWESQAAEVLGIAARTLPATADDLAGAVHPDDSAAVHAAVARMVAAGAVEVVLRVGQHADLRYLSLRGKVLTRDRRNRPLRAVGLIFDVTADKATEDQMLRMVMSDALTGVPNRRAFQEVLRTEWRRCARALEPLSVLMIDIDDFKAFNDSFGHLVGDAALIAVARALSITLQRAGDGLARYGGEEFVVVLPGVDAAGAFAVADRLVHAVRSVSLQRAPGWNTTVSIGAATWVPGSAMQTAADLLAAADTALYAAKAAGKDRAVASYDPSPIAGRSGSECLPMVPDRQPAAGGPHGPDTIDHILDHGDVRCVFQPIVDLATDTVVAYEALARGPAGPLAAPDALFSAAKRAGRLADLDELCRLVAVRSAIEVGIHAPLTLFLNVEPAGLRISSLDHLVQVAQSAPHPLRLVLEVTERELAACPADLLAAVTRLREAGWRIALDDVGADDMSLTFLSVLRPDIVKIDMGIVQRRPDAATAELMNALNAYAERSGAVLLAEGIEDLSHLAAAQALGARLGQGWLFGRPAGQPTPHRPIAPLRLPPPVTAGTALSPFDCLPADTDIRVSSKALLIQVSIHLEQQAARLGRTAVVLSSFQRDRYFTGPTRDRYRRLALDVGFVAAFGQDIPANPVDGVRGADLTPDDPLRDEWDIVVLAPHFAAALLARDLAPQPGRTGTSPVPERNRQFEFVLTYDRETVTAAAGSLMSRVRPGPTRPSPQQV